MRMLNDNEITYVSGADDGKGAGSPGCSSFPSIRSAGGGFLPMGSTVISNGYSTSASVGFGADGIAETRVVSTPIQSSISFSISASGLRDFSAGMGAVGGIAAGIAIAVPAPPVSAAATMVAGAAVALAGVAELGAMAIDHFAGGAFNMGIPM